MPKDKSDVYNFNYKLHGTNYYTMPVFLNLNMPYGLTKTLKTRAKTLAKISRRKYSKYCTSS
jgi:hypothetical protein